jgi:thioredoxin 1
MKEIYFMSITTITSANYEAEVMQSDKPVMIDFWASWCGPCKMLSPIVDEIAEETPSVKVCKINIDEQPHLAEKFGVMSIPTLVLIKNGEVVNTSVGLKPKSAVKSFIEG